MLVPSEVCQEFQTFLDNWIFGIECDELDTKKVGLLFCTLLKHWLILNTLLGWTHKSCKREEGILK